MLHIMEISEMAHDRFLVLNKTEQLWLLHRECLELMARQVEGGAAFEVVAIKHHCYRRSVCA